MLFEWDAAKNDLNIAKHGIDFVLAKEIFSGPVLEFIDHRRNYGETRIIAIGEAHGRELTLVYAPGGESKRIISARRASQRERRRYRETYPW